MFHTPVQYIRLALKTEKLILAISGNSICSVKELKYLNFDYNIADTTVLRLLGLGIKNVKSLKLISASIILHLLFGHKLKRAEPDFITN